MRESQACAGTRVRIIHTIPSIAEVSSGPTYSVMRLAAQLVGSGHDLTLACLDRDGHPPTPSWVTRFPGTRFGRRLGFSPAMRRWLRSLPPDPQTIIHNHSLWMMPNVYAGDAARRLRIPYVVSPRGTLQPAAFHSGSMLKRAFWPLVQRPSLAGVRCFHATSESEATQICTMGFGCPIAVIPNGIDLPNLPPDDGHRRKEVLYLGRIHPIKGIDVLLRAWRRLEPVHAEWSLRIVGPDNRGHLDRMQALAAELGVERVRFEGELVGDRKVRAYREASAYVLPSRTENFAMTVAESLACATPAIVSRGAPWQGLGARQCGWWVDAQDDAIGAALHQAMSCEPSVLREMGMRGQEWMRAEFSWEAVGRRMEDLYRWVLSGMPRDGVPSTIVSTP